jgi:lipopolysaccharide O-acetyltransferase
MKLSAIFRTYGVRGSIRLALDVMITKIFFPGARIIRRPAYVRGPGKIRFGAGFTSGPGLRIDCWEEAASLVIGKGVQVNNNVHIGVSASVVIGDQVLIASNVFISDHSHGVYSGAADHSSPMVPPAERVELRMPVIIEDNVWLGEHVCVLPGVHIGKGVVVGAGSVVTRSLPEYSIAVGAPARVVKRFDFSRKVWVPAP